MSRQKRVVMMIEKVFSGTFLETKKFRLESGRLDAVSWMAGNIYSFVCIFWQRVLDCLNRCLGKVQTIRIFYFSRINRYNCVNFFKQYSIIFE